MKNLKTLGIIGASVVALGAASAMPASAQNWRHHDGYARQLNTSYVDSLAWKIDNAARNRVINWQQARMLHDQLRSVQPIAFRVERGEASQREYMRLSRVVDRIETMTRTYASNGYRDGYRDGDRPYAYGYRR